MTVQNNKDKEKILKSTRKTKRVSHLKGLASRRVLDFSAAALEAKYQEECPQTSEGKVVSY